MSDKREFKHLGKRLRAERPTPGSGLIDAIMARAPEPVRRHPKASVRIALAGALTIALLSAAAAVGGIGGVSTVTKKDQKAGAAAYGQKPVITMVTPKASCPGRKIVIHGMNFTGATSVTIDGISAQFKVLNDKTILAVVPVGFNGGPVTVTTPGGTATSPKGVKLKCPGSD